LLEKRRHFTCHGIECLAHGRQPQQLSFWRVCATHASAPPLQVDLSGYGHLNLLPLASGAPLPANIQRLEMDMALVEASDRVRCVFHPPPPLSSLTECGRLHCTWSGGEVEVVSEYIVRLNTRAVQRGWWFLLSEG
jgi:hypothetical protein